jgi:hypothetical protein
MADTPAQSETLHDVAGRKLRGSADPMHIGRSETDGIIANLPLDWNHHPADAKEGWEMLCRAKGKYDLLQRALSASERKLRECRGAMAIERSDTYPPKANP